MLARSEPITRSSSRSRDTPSISAYRSYRQIAADHRLVHVLAASGDHNLAALHNEISGGQIAGEIEILLDQKDCHVAAFGESADDTLDTLDD